MINLHECIKKNNLIIDKIISNNKYILLEGTEKYLLIENDNNNKDLFTYFDLIEYDNYQPRINSYQDSYGLYKYESDNTNNIDLKAKALLNTIISLQNKTIIEESINEEEIDKIYKKYISKIDSLMKYYLELQDYIDELFLPRIDYYYLLINLSKIYQVLNISHNKLENWYQTKNKIVRKCHIIGNTCLNNFIKGEKNYFIDYNDSKKDLLINDFIYFYQKDINKVNMLDLYQEYISKISLTTSEKELLEVIICIPKKIVLNSTIKNNIDSINNQLTYIEKTLDLILEEDKKYQETDKDKFKEQDKNI